MIDIMVDDDVTLPAGEEAIIRAVRQSCKISDNMDKVTLCIRFSSDAVVRELNGQWRDKDKVTDVLSFPMQDGEIDPEESLGDIIIAQPFVAEEAKRLQLPEADHVLHLIVHGTLHLLGYDHIEDDEAEVMQQMENRVMKTLGLHQPYAEFIVGEETGE